MYYYDCAAQKGAWQLLKPMLAKKIAEFRTLRQGLDILGPSWVHYNSEQQFLNRFKWESTL